MRSPRNLSRKGSSWWSGTRPKARALMAISDDDALNAFVTITARKLNADLKIIAMVSSRENMQKLRSVGATNVISPSVIGAERILAAALGDED
jgi:voltage-gated potassium channel